MLGLLGATALPQVSHMPLGLYLPCLAVLTAGERFGAKLVVDNGLMMT
jgi:hypothetical protein